ncbi:hypothetical protein ACHWQZ_G010654 [Mnemiopsis leidyi]
MPRVKNLASFGRRSTYSGALGVKARNLEVDRDSKQLWTVDMWKRSSSWTDTSPLSSSTPGNGLRGFGSQEQLQRHRGSLEILRTRSNSLTALFSFTTSLLHINFQLPTPEAQLRYFLSPGILPISWDTSHLLGYFLSPGILPISWDTSHLLGYFPFPGILPISWDTSYLLGYFPSPGILSIFWDTSHLLGYFPSPGILPISWDTSHLLGYFLSSGILPISWDTSHLLGYFPSPGILSIFWDTSHLLGYFPSPGILPISWDTSYLLGYFPSLLGYFPSPGILPISWDTFYLLGYFLSPGILPISWDTSHLLGYFLSPGILPISPGILPIYLNYQIRADCSFSEYVHCPRKADSKDQNVLSTFLNRLFVPPYDGVTPPLYNDTVNTSQFPERFMDLEGDDVDLEGDDVDLDDITVILDQDRCTVDIIKSAQVRLSVRCTL